ncbi:hypothetical protein GEMRC1_013092 [Eukaryota sp. GEM-RC1]
MSSPQQTEPPNTKPRVAESSVSSSYSPSSIDTTPSQGPPPISPVTSFEVPSEVADLIRSQDQSLLELSENNLRSQLLHKSIDLLLSKDVLDSEKLKFHSFKDLLNNHEFVQLESPQSNVIKLFKSRPWVQSSEVQSSDPLLGQRYQAGNRDEKFSSAVMGLLHVMKNPSLFAFLERFHSPILPVINSTGLGKTRLLLSNLGELIHSYFCFPRYSGNYRVHTWPPIQEWHFSRKTLFPTVVFYECFSVTLITIYRFQKSIDLDKFDWLKFFQRVIDGTSVLFQRTARLSSKAAPCLQ